MKNVKTTKSLSSFEGTSMNLAAMKQVQGGWGGLIIVGDCGGRPARCLQLF